MAPEVRGKSGVWYRLNRWREEQMTSGKHPTYGELVRQYIVLSKMPRFEKIPHGRYINFVAEFLAADKRGDACRGYRCVDRAQGARHPQGLCVLDQGATEAQGKEQMSRVTTSPSKNGESPNSSPPGAAFAVLGLSHILQPKRWLALLAAVFAAPRHLYPNTGGNTITTIAAQTAYTGR
jgi:hypothetical protein